MRFLAKSQELREWVGRIPHACAQRGKETVKWGTPMEINYLRLQMGRVTYEVYRWKETSLREVESLSDQTERENVRCLKTQRNSDLEKGDVFFF